MITVVIQPNQLSGHQAFERQRDGQPDSHQFSCPGTACVEMANSRTHKWPHALGKPSKAYSLHVNAECPRGQLEKHQGDSHVLKAPWPTSPRQRSGAVVFGAAVTELFKLCLHARGGKPEEGCRRAPVSHQPDAIPLKGSSAGARS